VKRNSTLTLAGPLVVWLLLPSSGLAHAIVLESRPAPNAVVAGPDVSMELRFNSRIDRKRSRVTLAGPDGSSVPVPVRESEQPDRIEGGVAGLAPGDYKLKWQVLSVDGHITRGEIPFHISRP
jgi:methionine-rich copper-binding protein CopC